ncbi:unnamed protein product, partial [Rotaria sp. Silwood2]
NSTNDILDPVNVELNITNSNTNSTTRFGYLTEFLKSYMSDIHIKEEHGDQITYIIIDDAEHTKIFPKMFADLDENRNQYHVKSYGLSNSSLEQVFLRVADEKKRPKDYKRLSRSKKMKILVKKCFGKNETKEEQNEDTTNEAENNNDQEQFNEYSTDEWSSYADERYTSISYLAVQVSGLFIKRFHRTKRNIKALLSEILLPVIFIFLAILFIKIAPDDSNPPPLILHPWHWGKPNYIFQSISINQSSLLSKSIQQTFIQSPSLGTRCMTSTILDTQLYPCDSADAGYYEASTSEEIMNALNNVDYYKTRISPKCDCWQTMQKCPIGARGPLPSFDKTETEDTLYRLFGYNISDWVVKTEFLEEYLMKRFGGFEFLLQNDLNSIDLLNETLINKLMYTISQINKSTSMIDAAKVAALFRVYPPQISIWYNNQGWPASVSFVNVFNNALLRGVLLEKNSSISIGEYGITAINHPLPETQIEIDNNIEKTVTLQLLTVICVIFALAFIPASFLVFLIDENSTTSKHLQFVSGVKGD